MLAAGVSDGGDGRMHATCIAYTSGRHAPGAKAVRRGRREGEGRSVGDNPGPGGEGSDRGERGARVQRR